MAFFSRPTSSAAIKIVRPAADDAPLPKAKKESAPKLCRNILIHGVCKYEGKGCTYQHPVPNGNENGNGPALDSALSTTDSTVVSDDTLDRPSLAFAPDAPAFVPSASAAPSTTASSSTLSNPPLAPSAVAAPAFVPSPSRVFVPKSVSTPIATAATPPPVPSQPALSSPAARPASAAPALTSASSAETDALDEHDPFDPCGPPTDADASVAQLNHRLQSASINPYDPASRPNPYASPDPSVYTSPENPYAPLNPSHYLNSDPHATPYGGADVNPYATPDPYDTPFYDPSQSAYVRHPLDYHLYTAPRPSALEHRYFLADDVREELQRRSEEIRQVSTNSYGLPDKVQGYHTFVPLEPPTTALDVNPPPGAGPSKRMWVNWFSTVYRATKQADGQAYALRRMEKYRLANAAALAPIEAWSRIRHPNVVSVHEGFTARGFGDSSLVVVYDYHPNAQTLFDAHIRPTAVASQNGYAPMSSRAPAGSNTNGRGLYYSTPTQVHGSGQGTAYAPGFAEEGQLPERTLWTYIIQIANAIKTVHDAGLAVRVIDPSKILVTGKNRIRIASCGILDVLMHEHNMELAMLQQEDLASLGRLVISLCCGGPQGFAMANNAQKAIDFIGMRYSPDVKAVTLFLTSKPGPHKSIGRLFEMVGSRLLTELDETQTAVDRLEGELMSELENGRLVRLLCKFGFINERPEFGHEPRWSDTGDRYIVKLFRDYVFHQVDEQGRPALNLGHVLACLNKLDAGIDERIMLVSRDEQSCLVVSYREIKACIESSFAELVGR